MWSREPKKAAEKGAHKQTEAVSYHQPVTRDSEREYSRSGSTKRNERNEEGQENTRDTGCFTIDGHAPRDSYDDHCSGGNARGAAVDPRVKALATSGLWGVL